MACMRRSGFATRYSYRTSVMKYNTLGNTGLFVSELFGTMTFVAVKPPLRKRIDAIE